MALPKESLGGECDGVLGLCLSGVAIVVGGGVVGWIAGDEWVGGMGLKVCKVALYDGDSIGKGEPVALARGLVG